VRKERKTEIISGFHWFNTSSRDTFISLPGLTLPLNDRKTFKAVLDTMVSRLKDGLFPDVGPDDGLEYNSVDAPLWFIWALQKYFNKTGDSGFVWKNYGKVIKNILSKFKEGTSHDIKTIDNGLIYAGKQGIALTWMNALVNGKPVINRTGCPVEVNALWYNAIVFSLEMARKSNDLPFIKKWKSLEEKVKISFIKTFWDEEKKYLADYVDGEYKNWCMRPNQVIATSLSYSPLSEEMKKSILEVVRRELLTPRGLRTLGPSHPDYVGKYTGNPEKRDNAYHQGTVWPWLIEYFCEGYLNLYKRSGLSFVKNIIKDFEPTMNEHGIGTISEIYDGDPPHLPRGAISSAKSIAALLTIIEKTEELERTDK
jgi:predicted glycogen debranching enzyme